MEKGVRNARRKATDNDKNLKHFRGETSEKQAAKARQTERLIERLDVVQEPRKEWELRMSIAAAPRAGAVVATARGVVVRRGRFTLGPVDLQIDWADRVAITGPNGGGKSTLLAVLLGRLAPDEGTASLGPGVVVGEVDQARRRFLGETTFLDAFREATPELAPAEARTLLAKFGLGADHVTRPAASLSPGERTRAALALLQAQGVNLLVLDEPTNHLDISGHRAAGGSARVVRRDAAAGHPRPADARHGGGQPRARCCGRSRHRVLTSLLSRPRRRRGGPATSPGGRPVSRTRDSGRRTSAAARRATAATRSPRRGVARAPRSRDR
jgi:ABC-type molybdenum transport system ATPase subunit/photorepair protein PhrA